MANNNVQTTVTVGMDVNLAKRNAEALKQVIVDLKAQLKEARAAMDTAVSADAFKRAGEAVDNLILKIKTLEKVQRSATPAAAYESFISGDTMNSNTLRQAQRGAKNRLNTVNEFAGDKEARKFLDDIDRTQMRLNRLQAGFTNPLQAVRRELNDLSGGELKRLHTLLQQEQVLVKGNESAWSAYSAAIAKVDERIREYDTLARQQMGASILSQSQRNGFAQANERDINRAIEKLREYRTVINDPNGAGKATWEATTREILKLQATLDTLKQKTAEMKGEAMSLTSAYRAGLQAGNGTFKGSTQQLELAKKTLQDQLALVERGSKQYNQLQKAIQGCEMEEKRMGMTAKDVQAVLDKPKGKSYNELKIAVEQGRMALAKMRTETDADKKKFDELAAKVKEADIQMKQLANTSKGSATAFEKAWSRLKTYISLYMGAAVAIQKITATFGDLMELSDKMGEVRKTTGFTADEVGRLSDNLKRLDVRTSLTQLMEISAKAGQLGLKTEKDVMGFTEAANKLMIALPEMGAEAATEMMKVALATGEVKKIQDQLNKGIVEGSSATEVALSKIGSTIDQLRANSAAAAPQITDFVKRVGAVGAQSGITIDQIAALGATVDAVGLRVEMSATALSRMIPAIRNNAFEVAKAIGMAPETLRAMFDEAGGGMEAMLAIFQHIKDSGMDADSIEKMLGIGNMQDVMKDLNQQGARAGIVFAGLSQNVEELRRNLGVAAEAYEDNIAILQEYNKMNDTTAAKWERFKNQLEEFFVGDSSQRMLGGIIDGLRAVVDLLTGNNGVSAVLRTIGVYLAIVKLNIAGIVTGVKSWSVSLKGIAMAIGLIDKQTKKLAWGNIFTALAMAALWAWREIVNLKSALDKASESLGKTKEEVNRSIDRFEGYWEKLKSTNEALLQAKVSHEKLSAEVDKLRKSTDGSAESTANLKKKEDELTTSEKNVTKASNDHKSAIAQMNSIYGKYLGFILTEANYSNLAAAAHDKVTAAIEREILMKQRQAAIGEVDSNYSENIAKDYGELNERLVQYGNLSRSEAAKAMSDMQRFMRENLKYDAGTNATVVSKSIMDEFKRKGLDVSKADANQIAGLWFDQYLKENYHLNDKVRRGLTGVMRSKQNKGWENVYTPFATNLRSGYAGTYAQREQARGAVSAVYGVDIEDSERRETKASGQLLANLEKSAQNAKKVILDKNVDNKKRNEAYGELANALEGLDNRINELDPQKDAATISRLNEMAKSLKSEGIDIKKLKQAREKIHQTLFERATFNEEDIRNLNTTNPWGDSHEAASTDWKNMTAEQLVTRRKQMKDFVNAIQTDTDVQSVLKEDAALKKAIENGMSSDMRTVIEWYNTERLKIQDELHARHLTNTGDWMDPKKQRSRKKMLHDETKAFLDELDAYYTERKAKIQEAGNEEGLTEAEVRNRTLANEMEWRQRRMELQKMYGDKASEVTKEEQDAIFAIIAERTDDDDKMIKAYIQKTVDFVKQIGKLNEQGAKEAREFWAKMDKGAMQDLMKEQTAVHQQLKAIQDIIDKERPFNGITKNLRENLATMGILTADMTKERDRLMKEGKDMADFNARQAAEEIKRTAFMLGEAENAYSTTIEEVMRHMADKGMTAWVDELRQSPKMQEGLMASLRQSYDSIQDAIKKEASQLKKQAEIMWNNILMPDGKTTLKDAVDRAVAQLSIDQGRVSRANSLIGAGQASERVADKLAIKQMQIQLTMQEHYYNLMRKRGKAAVDLLEEQARLARERGEAEKATRLELDAQHARMALNLATAKEETELAKQREEIIARTEETQNRLYKELREWGNLLASSVQSVFEASHAGDKEYYNELAKMNLTGKGGPGAGTYIIIDNEGTPDAKAHYEYLDERQALEREHEIERENAQAEAWRKVMDDINMKMSESITDWINAFLQNQSIDANTAAVIANTQALYDTMGGKGSSDFSEAEKLSRNSEGFAVDGSGQVISPIPPTESSEQTATTSYWPRTEEEYNKMMGYDQAMWDNHVGYGIERLREMSENVAEMPSIVSNPVPTTDEQLQSLADKANAAADAKIAASERETNVVVKNANKQKEATKEANNEEVKSTTTSYAKMAAAVNMYGVAYQTMSNDNLDSFQKFQMFALQAAGQTAIAMLTTDAFKAEGDAAVRLPGIFGKAVEGLGPIAGPIAFAAMTALLGGLMGLAVSKVAKSKSQISQVTGASVSAGRLATGMLTYAEGNVNEFTDPSSLTPGRQYNVDGADGKTYRARYMGKGAKTHITNGPEFHLVGEKGQEAIIDAHTTRNIQINEPEIWHTIQTLYNGGRITNSRVRRGRGMAAFAEGNLNEFEEMGAMGDMGTMKGIGLEEVTALRTSLDRQNELWERILAEGIHANFDVYGKGGLVDSYDTGKKNVTRHGERY